MIEGTHVWQLMDEFKPVVEDLVLKKYSPSLFVGTIAEQVLRNNDVDTCDQRCQTEVGIETTARHAACLGFVPVIVEDAVGGGDMQTHESALSIMRKMFEVRKTAEIIQAMKTKSPRPNPKS